MSLPGPGVFSERAALGVPLFNSSMEIGWMGSTYLYEDQLQFSKKIDYFTKVFKCICWQLCKVVIPFFLFCLFIILCICVFSILSSSLKLCWSFPRRFSSSSAVFVFNNSWFILPFLGAWPHQAACGILVLQPGIKPRTLRQWACSVPTTGPPGNSLFSNYLVSFINFLVLYIAVRVWFHLIFLYCVSTLIYFS